MWNGEFQIHGAPDFWKWMRLDAHSPAVSPRLSATGSIGSGDNESRKDERPFFAWPRS